MLPNLLTVRLLLVLLLNALASAAVAQVDAIYDRGSGALLRQLQRLQTTASVLHTGAHPDDEDSALVAYHARGLHARTAYLSLTRGSGGQNIIGPEQSDALGVIRTEELLQARTLDGAEQLFTRANDFGFSKHLAEAARVWPEELLLADLVRAIRSYRPQVIISRWNGTPADGHGHHQFSGYLSALAFVAAGDPNRFPEQIAAGLRPWQARKLYTGRPLPDAEDDALLRVNTGQYDASSGRSYFEIGMRGRSQQKTQSMGSLELHGRQISTLQLLESYLDSSVQSESVFSGIDLSIAGIAEFEAGASLDFVEQLNALQDVAATSLSRYDPLDPQALVPYLAEGLVLARTAMTAAQSLDARRLLAEKVGEFEESILLATGASIDALAEVETVIPGTTFGVAVRFYAADATALELRDSRLELPSNWSATPSRTGSLANEVANRRMEQADAESYYAVTVPPEARPSQPYWLRLPREGAAYDWGEAGTAWNQPFSAPLLTAVATLVVNGIEVEVRKEVVHRQRDRIRGELRRRLDVVPAISVEPAADLEVIPLSEAQRPRELMLTVRNNANRSVSGTARFDLPQGWTLEPPVANFSLDAALAITSLAFRVTPPADIVAGEYRLLARAQADGVQYGQAMTEIAYPHIRSHRLYTPSETEFEVVDVDVAAVRVGYVMGSGDLVPEALRRLGLDVDLLSDADLTSGDLGAFDTIVVGIRASQTRPAFVANNRRLLDFAAAGGTLVVQYQQPDFIDKDLAPFPASMDGNVRVVDETAPIVILAPEHPVFSFPNAIEARDFDGWVQERNNYNFTSFDRDRYVPLTEAHDEGEPPSDGGMLYARIGEGHYVYTAYSWFRQLPNGVPGAYRLFANLLSLPAAPE